MKNKTLQRVRHGTTIPRNAIFSFVFFIVAWLTEVYNT